MNERVSTLSKGLRAFLPVLASCVGSTHGWLPADAAQELSIKNQEKRDILKILPVNWQQLTTIRDFNQYLQLNQIRPDNATSHAKLSEAEIVIIGLANSPEIRSSIYQYRQADYQAKSAYGAYLPNLSAFENSGIGGNYSSTTFNYGGSSWGSTTLQRLQKQNIDSNNTGITNYFQGLLGVQLSFNLIDVPRDLTIAAAIENRLYYKTLISYAVKQKLQSLRLAVLQIQTADQLIEAYTQSANFAKSAYEQILKSYEGGYSTRIDVDNYYALYNSYQANLATSISSRQAAVSQLLSQMSWPQTVDIDVKGTMHKPKEWPLSLEKSIVFANANSEQVEALLIQSKINNIQAKNELAGYLPVISVNGYGYKDNQIGIIDIGYPSGTTSKSFYTGISVNLNWTLFDGLSNLNNAKSYKQSMRSYEQQSLTEKYSIEQSVGNFYASIKANSIAYTLNANAYQAQRRLTGLTLIGFKTGYNTVFDLVNAQQNTVNSQISQIQSQQTANSSLIQIQTFTGGYMCNDEVVRYACELLLIFNPKDFTNLETPK